MKSKIVVFMTVFSMIFTYGKSQVVPVTDADRVAANRSAADRATADAAADGEEYDLHPPERGGGRPFMELLNERRSTRTFTDRELEPHHLSGLLWAANGVNREEDGKRTAPSARDMREIDIYVITPKGAFLYIPEVHQMRLVKSGDFRKEAVGRSDFAAVAPVILVFVANAKKMEKIEVASRDNYAHIDCGYVSQNVYLYCASEKLATVAIGGVNKEAMAKILGLKNDKVILSQPVGYMH